MVGTDILFTGFPRATRFRGRPLETIRCCSSNRQQMANRSPCNLTCAATRLFLHEPFPPSFALDIAFAFCLCLLRSSSSFGGQSTKDGFVRGVLNRGSCGVEADGGLSGGLLGDIEGGGIETRMENPEGREEQRQRIVTETGGARRKQRHRGRDITFLAISKETSECKGREA